MPYLSEKKRIQGTEFDRRRKLTPEDKEEIKELYKTGLHSYNTLARKFGVSKRLIMFVIKPEKHDENYRQRVERGGSKQYYEKKSHTASIRRMRNWKQLLHLEGKI